MSLQDSKKLETVKILMLKGEKGDQGAGSYDDTEIRGLITAEAQARASSDTAHDLEIAALDTRTDTAEDNIDGLKGRLDTAENDIDVLDARMDTFASLTNGSTTGDAELTDIRVAYDGATYASAGGAVRSQASDLMGKIKLSNNGRESIGMLSKFVRGALWDGEIQSYGNYRIANESLITFEDATQVKIASGFWIQIAFFVNGSYSSATSWTANLYNIPAGSTVRFSIRRETENTSETADIGEFTNAVTILSSVGKLMEESPVIAMGGINASNYSTLGIDSVTDLPANTIWGISIDITSAMITDLPMYGVYGQIKKTVGLVSNNIYILYEYTSEHKDKYIAWQNNNSSTLSSWTRLATGNGEGLTPVSARTLITSSSKVYFIGDSIVAGVGGTGWQQTSGRKILTYDGVDLYANDNGTCWANMLRDYLTTNYGCTAYNNGLSGFNSVNIPQNIAALVPSDATHVIASWGINDRAYNYDTVGGYQTVIDYCNSIGAKFVPLTICPCLQPNDTYAHTQFEILTRIKTVCANNNLEVCDLFSAVNEYFYTKGITLDTNYIPDNLHPNDAMYTIMYNLIRGLLGV